MTRSVAPRLRLFLNQMYLKLRENDHKGDWRLELSIPELWELLEDEIEELAQAINSNLGSQEIVRECADVANFAMMIADVAGGLVEDKSPVSSELSLYTSCRGHDVRVIVEHVRQAQQVPKLMRDRSLLPSIVDHPTPLGQTDK